MDEREVQVSVDQIKTGDRYGTATVGWTATADATTVAGVVTVPVVYADGGDGRRIWQDASREVVVRRG